MDFIPLSSSDGALDEQLYHGPRNSLPSTVRLNNKRSAADEDAGINVRTILLSSLRLTIMAILLRDCVLYLFILKI